MTIMLSYSLNQISVFIEYVVDIEAYTDKYCENKENKELNCHGKCHLTKELAQNEKEHEENDFQYIPKIEIINSIEEVKIEENTFTEYQQIFFGTPNFAINDLCYPILQPPKIVS